MLRPSLDTDALFLFRELMRTGSLTRAAAACSMSIGSASRLLGKMRETFGDDLFDRNSPVTSLTEYQADKDSVFVYSATAGANFDLSTGAFTSAPNPFINEFKWGAKEPSVEIQLKNCTGYQAWPFSVQKALSQEAK